jgi:hypothetical protein
MMIASIAAGMWRSGERRDGGGGSSSVCAWKSFY